MKFLRCDINEFLSIRYLRQASLATFSPYVRLFREMTSKRFLGVKIKLSRGEKQKD